MAGKAIAGVARMDKGSKVRQFKDDKQRPSRVDHKQDNASRD